MKKLLLNSIVLSALVASTPNIYAESVAHGYQLGDENLVYGFISFPVSGFANPTVDKRNYGELHVSAGECVDGLYYTFEVFADGYGGVTAYDYRVFDAKTFDSKKVVTFYSEDTRRVVDMTYDYTTNTMYALVENAANTSDISSTSLNVVDLETGECTVVGSPGDITGVDGYNRTKTEALLTLAADKDGNLYAMGEYRQFYKLNKFTGEATKISTSQHSIGTMNQFQSMAFDNEGVLYWAQTHPDYGYFLTIDPTTGVPSYMAEDPDPGTVWKNEGSIIGNNAEVTGLWFEKTFTGAAPSPVTSLTAKIVDGKPNSVNLTWALPTTNLKGNAVTVTGVKVYRLGTDEPIATLAADATSYTDDNAANGTNNYMVCAIAGEEHGRGAVVSAFAGADMLMPVSDLTATLDGAKVTISWTAPTSTYNGGYTDYNNITYNVWRICGSDEQIIARGISATTYVDELTASGEYYYSVEPISCGITGYAKDTETIKYVKPAETATIPYFSGFEDDGDGLLWQFVNNANHTQTTYGWSITSGYAHQIYDGKFAQLKSGGSSDANDDYMFSPAIKFNPGTYTLKYMVNGAVGTDKHSWTIYLADAQSATANKIADIESHTDEAFASSWVETAGSTFTVATAGTYYLAFHGTTTTTYATLKIDNINITAADASAISNVEADDAVPVEYYNLRGERINEPASGLVIVRYSNGSVKKQLLR
jgi:hypothetical protein